MLRYLVKYLISFDYFLIICFNKDKEYLMFFTDIVIYLY